MDEENVRIKFNHILREEMGNMFDLKPLPLDSEFKAKIAKNDKSISVKSELLECPKTGGIRMGAMELKGAMDIHFCNVPPAKEYDFPILGYTFVYANKCLMVVLDLVPISKDKEYMDFYLAPLKEVSQKYAWLPAVEGGRSGNVHEWAQAYDSGYSLYRWCDHQHLTNLEDAFKDYLRVFCDAINKARPLSNQEMRDRRDKLIKNYIYDYVTNDPGGAPMKMHFGEDWTERYLKDFLFAP